MAIVIGSTVVISGAASAPDGRSVARVDVSVDGGATYNTATGTVGWVYNWTATSLGTVTIRSRAVDSSGIQEDPPTTVVVTVAEPPTITSHFPADGANDVSPDANVTITFSKAMDPATVNNATVRLLDQSGALVPATVSYDVASRAATLDPTASLLTGAVYGVDVRGGLTEPTVKDLLGLSLSGPTAWIFTTSPQVLSVTPAPGATNISLGVAPAALFSEALDPTTVNAFTVLMTDATANPIPAQIIYVPSVFKVLVAPNALLQRGQTYTVTLKGGAVGNRITTSAGIPLAADYIWSFTIAPAPPPFPILSIWAPEDAPSNPVKDDPEPKELGLKFRSDNSGVVTGLRYYKLSAANLESREGRLWTSSGTLLGSVTITGESGIGWHQVSFFPPIPIEANTTYVVSYSAPDGHYAADPGYFESQGRDNGPLHAPRSADVGGNGVIGPIGEFPNQTSMSTNYWVDVVFRDTSALAPQVVGTSLGLPSGDATNATPQTIFSEPLDPASVNESTVRLVDQANNLVPANISYDANTFTVTITPDRLLHFGELYTVTLKGGDTAPHITDSQGTPLAYDYEWRFFTTGPFTSPEPILVLTSTRGNKFAQYYPEIFRAEGFRNFNVADIGQVTDQILSPYDVIILGETPLIPEDVTMLSNWVAAGGKLIAMRPDKQLASLLGISDAAASRSEAYLKVDTSREPGAGIVGATIQYHGTADLYTLEGDTQQVAAICSNPTEETPNPAVTLRSVGTNGGQAAAFAFDLAQSIVYTRQGNPAWAGQDRDGAAPIRTNDLFFGGAEPDWVNLDKVAIPQADELQRLLANLILSMSADKIPLPRFWYFPNMKKAVILMTGDDRGAQNGTQTTFDMLNAASPANCSIANWECYRATSWVSPESGLANDQAIAYVNQRFEVGAHISTNCENWTPETLDSFIVNAQTAFRAKYTITPQARTNRTHCSVWTDWATHPKVELNHDIRLDATYYYWPPQWVQNRPGFMTGSGIPMRYADLDGSIIDVYQAATHLTNETDNTPNGVNSLLDKALGPEGYYGVFGARYDYTDQFAATILNSAMERDVSLISAEQLLTWLDGRNASTFTNPAWNGTQLEFRMIINDGVDNVYAMIPNQGRGGQVSSITINDTTVTFEVQTIKGRSYAVFRAANGNVVATYAP